MYSGWRVPANPAARLRAVPERGEEELDSDDPVNLLTADEMARFMAALKEMFPQWYALAFTQFATASRFSEVSALRWEDIDEGRGIDPHPPGQLADAGVHGEDRLRRRRNPALTDELRGVLSEWRELLARSHRHADSGWVFPSKAGKPHHNASGMGKAFEACLKEIGVERRFSSHGLRRTANDLIRRVASGEVARAITGHVTERMTEHYSHVDVGEKKAAVEGMLRLVKAAGHRRRPATARSGPERTETGTQLGTFLGTWLRNRHIWAQAKKKAGRNLFDSAGFRGGR